MEMARLNGWRWRESMIGDGETQWLEVAKLNSWRWRGSIVARLEPSPSHSPAPPPGWVEFMKKITRVVTFNRIRKSLRFFSDASAGSGGCAHPPPKICARH